jgi:hypothetical protein
MMLHQRLQIHGYLGGSACQKKKRGGILEESYGAGTKGKEHTYIHRRGGEQNCLCVRSNADKYAFGRGQKILNHVPNLFPNSLGTSSLIKV